MCVKWCFVCWHLRRKALECVRVYQYDWYTSSMEDSSLNSLFFQCEPTFLEEITVVLYLSHAPPFVGLFHWMWDRMFLPFLMIRGFEKVMVQKVIIILDWYLMAGALVTCGQCFDIVCSFRLQVSIHRYDRSLPVVDMPGTRELRLKMSAFLISTTQMNVLSRCLFHSILMTRETAISTTFQVSRM